MLPLLTCLVWSLVVVCFVDIVAVGENIQKITMNGDEDANDTGASSTTIQV